MKTETPPTYPQGDTTPPVETRPTPPYGRYARWLILAGLAVLALWLVLKVVRVASATQSLLNTQSEAAALLEGGLSQIDPTGITDLTYQVRADTRTLAQELGPLAPLAGSLGWVPRVGPLLAAAPSLLTMADAGTQAAAFAVTALEPGLAMVAENGLGLAAVGAVLPVIEESEAELVAASIAMDQYVAAREQLAATVPLESLPWRAQQLLTQVDAITPLAQGGLALLPSLPAILGADGPRTYLIMAQNEDELRPTGGFLTGAGLLSIENGQIINLAFQDANQVDNWAEKPYAAPPEPLERFMLSELFLFRDANFWADFPTSAQIAMDLYAYGQDIPAVDGAIAIDQEFLRLLVGATGPIPVPGSEATINQDNLIQTLRQARDVQEGQEVRDWVNNRKAFLAGFADAILSKLEGGAGDIDPVLLAQAMSKALESGHMQIYIPDETAALQLARAGWDGRLPAAPPGDFWQVVDTNMSFNKANVYIDRHFDYAIALGGSPTATLTVTYVHSGPALDEPCYQGVSEEFEEGADYLALADKCYWNYIRFFVPAGSQLLDSTRHIVPAETLFNATTHDSQAQPVEERANLATFANFLLVPVAGTVESFIQYELPPGVVTQQGGTAVYELNIGKQPGTRPEPTTVVIDLPAGAQLLSAMPEPQRIEGGRLSFELLLESPTSVTIRYR